MLRNNTLSHIVRFVVLVLIQVLLLSRINFFGYINPYLYLLFIILLPIDQSEWKTILLGFLLGLSVDMFLDSGGMHAMACLVAAYVRPLVLRFTYGVSYDYQTIKFYKTPFNERLTYISLMVAIHHLVLFILVFFNVSHAVLILKNTLFSGIFTVLLILIVNVLFKRRED